MALEPHPTFVVFSVNAGRAETSGGEARHIVGLKPACARAEAHVPTVPIRKPQLSSSALTGVGKVRAAAQEDVPIAEVQQLLQRKSFITLHGIMRALRYAYIPCPCND